MIKNNLKYRDLSHLSTMLTLSCRDVGLDCDYIINGKIEEEVIQYAVQHAWEIHAIKPEEMTSEMKEKIKSHIRRS